MERKQKLSVKTTRAKTWTWATLFFEAQVKACFFPGTTLFVANPPQQQNFSQQNSEMCDLSEKILFVSKDFSRSVLKKPKSKSKNKISSQRKFVIFQHFSCSINKQQEISCLLFQWTTRQSVVTLLTASKLSYFLLWIPSWQPENDEKQQISWPSLGNFDFATFLPFFSTQGKEIRVWKNILRSLVWEKRILQKLLQARISTSCRVCTAVQNQHIQWTLFNELHPRFAAPTPSVPLMHRVFGWKVQVGGTHQVAAKFPSTPYNKNRRGSQ